MKTRLALLAAVAPILLLPVGQTDNASASPTTSSLNIAASSVLSCPVPTLPGVGCPVPSGAPLPGTSASPSPAPADPSPSSSSPTPSPSVAATGTASGDASVPQDALLPRQAPLATLAPQVAATGVPMPTATPAHVPAAEIRDAPLPQSLAAAFAFVTLGLLALPLLLGLLAGLRPVTGTTSTPSGVPMPVHTSRRLLAGFGVLGLAALVAVVGWYRVSGEPLLNRQVPYLASAGLCVVLLSVLAGSLIVSEQLKDDSVRISELQDAVHQLTEALAPTLERPRRGDTPPAHPETAKAVSTRGTTSKPASARPS